MKTPIQTAIEQVEERIKYLRNQEGIALQEIDSIPSPSFLRDMKWKPINELAARRNELEMSSLKPLQSLLPYEMECIEGSYKEGEAVGLNHCAETAHDYFTNTFKQ